MPNLALIKVAGDPTTGLHEHSVVIDGQFPFDEPARRAERERARAALSAAFCEIYGVPVTVTFSDEFVGPHEKTPPA